VHELDAFRLAEIEKNWEKYSKELEDFEEARKAIAENAIDWEKKAEDK